MSDTFNVKITATETATPAFRSIAAEAKKTDSILDGMGDGALKALQAIERNTAEAGEALRDFAKASEEAANSTKGFNQGAAAAGSAAASLVVGLGQLGQANIQQERQIAAIGRLYGSQADEVLKFAEALQDTTTFSNDAARQAALSTASLVQNYGFQADQIENLIGLGADYAAMYGLELTDATERLTAAMRGEGEAAEALGLTLNDANVARYAASLGITNYSSGLDEAGRATVRYALLLEQSSVVEGYAVEMAGTRAGQVAQFVNSLQDLGQSAGDVLGPVGEVAAIAANYGPSFILASGAVGGFVGQLKTAATAVNGFKLGSLAIGAAVGPIGLLAAGLGTVALGFAKAAENAQRADLAVAGVQNSIAQAFSAGLFPESVILNSSDQISEAISQAMSDLDSNGADFDFGSFTGFAASAIGAFYEAFVGDPRLTQIGNAVSQIVNYGFTSGADNASLVVDELYNLNSSYGMGVITLDQYAAGITGLSGNLESFGLITQDLNGKFVINVDLLNQMTTANFEATSAQDSANASIQNAIDLQDRLGISQRETLENAIAVLRTSATSVAASGGNATPLLQEADLLQARVDELQASLVDLGVTLGDTFRADIFGDLPSQFGAIEDGFQTMIDNGKLTAAQADEMSAAFDRLQMSGASTLQIVAELGDVLYGEAPAADGFSATSKSFLEFAATLEAVVGRTQGVLDLYGAIDSLGQPLSEAAGIADNLFGEGGDAFDGLGPLRDLLDSGRISQDQFNASVQAGVDIQADNARGQAALNEVRSDQLPMLAEQTDALANYYETLADMGQEEQRHTLWLLDSANQQALLTTQTSLYAASIGELPEQYVVDMILSRAAWDPEYAAILKEQGVLVRDPITQEYRVVVPEGESVAGTIADLNDTLKDLGSLIAEINGLPDPFAATASGAEAATLSTDGLTASTLALWEAMGAAPIVPPPTPPPPGLPGLTPGLTGGGPAGGVGFGGGLKPYPGTTPPNIAPTPPGLSIETLDMWARLRGETPPPRAFPGYGPGETPSTQTAPQGGTANTVISMRTILDDGATPGLERLSELAQDLDGRQALPDALANDEASPKLRDVGSLFDGFDGKSATLEARANDEASPKFAEIGTAFAGIDGRSALLMAFGDDQASRKALDAGSAFDGINGKSALLFANGDSSSAEAAAAAGAGAIYAMDGTTGFVYAEGIDSYSGVINAAASYNGVVLSTSYIDIVTRQYTAGGSVGFEALAHGGVVGYADGGVLPTAALGRVLVGENGPEIATLPGGTLITPSPASQAIARQMRGEGGTSVNLYNYGTIQGIEDLAGFIYDGLAQAAAMNAASQGGR